MADTHQRGDRWAGAFIGAHLLIAAALAPAHETWGAVLLGGGVAATFYLCAWRLPGAFVTRCVAGIALQAFCALHIYQWHGLPEMHFFFFTAVTMMLVYQDWRALWPGVLLIVAQHVVFAALHNAGADVHFFETAHVDAVKLAFHFGIALVQTGIASYWAFTLRRQTVRAAAQHAELRQSETRLTHQAFHDDLTGLPNRALFLDRLAQALASTGRSSRGVAVLFLDVDDFKTVNDSLGHAEGDRLLVAVAERLRGCTRTCDTVARFGGDEFAVLVSDVGTACEAVPVVERVTAALARPFTLGGPPITVTASVGIAPGGAGHTPDALLRNADVAMYTAKAAGKGHYAVFEPAMHAAALGRMQLEADLHRAIERDEFVLHYQPIVSLESGRIAGVEALVRWQHPERGLVSPGSFIPLAEETGLILPLGRWVLREACRQVREWQRCYAGVQALKVSVNVSGRHVQDPGLIADVREALGAAGLDARYVVLELTESVLMQHTEATLEQMRALKGLGVSLAIDDFGTGYSSLGYLQRFPIDVLKIDKSFVDAVGSGTTDPVLARMILVLGETLGLTTVAEGIEHARQRDALLALGCEFGQGYHFARPLPACELGGLLAAECDRGTGGDRSPAPRGALALVRR